MEKAKSKKKLGMTTLIFIGLFLGAFTGIILYYFVPAGYMRDTVLVGWYILCCRTGLFKTHADAGCAACILLPDLW